MKNIKQYVSFATIFFMMTGIVSTNVQAEPNSDYKSQIKAVEVNGTPRLDELKTQVNEEKMEKKYEEDEVVTVIVELDEAATMDYYGSSSYKISGDEQSAGEALSQYLASDEVKEASEEILHDQEKIISKISKLAKKESRELKIENSFEVVDSWTDIVNAVAIKLPYGMIDKINEIDGIKRAYVEHTYSRPEPIENSVVQEGKANYSYSYDMVGVEQAWNEGYTGKGMLVAVLDTGLDIKMDQNSQIVRVHEAFTDDSFKSGNPLDGVDDWDLRYTNDSMKEFLEHNQLSSTTGQNGNLITYDNNALYKNIKVPYACDYADGDLHVLPTDSDHGTHVTGTIAGFAITNEGEIKFSGVAPDAQVLAMKVFPDIDGGAQESVIINALEDSLKLGADIINLSLGSDNGFNGDDTIQNDLYKRVNDAGIVMMTSAGNSYKSTVSNNYDGNSIASNPDEAMISSPAVYDSNLSVASIDNTIKVQQCFVWNDMAGVEHRVYFNDPWTVAMKADFSDKEYPIYAVDGVGTYMDYYNAGFNNGYNNGKTGIALVKRGEISFGEKINNALSFAGKNSHNESYGVLGVIVYDNDPEGTELITMSVSGTMLDSAFISGKDGAEIVDALNDGYQVSIQVCKVDDTIDNPTAGEMSSFSSWGAGPGLELKPEITAPGGEIWSTVLDKVNTGNDGYVGSYEMMSGTSMSAPHMSGIGLLIRQRVTNDSKFGSSSIEEIGNITSQLLMSTAIPQKDSNGVYYSPRQQGAGLVSADGAVKTNAYITVDSSNVTKLELGDDPEKTGIYDISFNVNNISNKDLKYNAEVILMRPDINVIDSRWGQRNVISDSDVIIKSVDLGEICAPAGNTISIAESIALTADEKSKLDSLFPNGTYVEGYVVLTDASGEGNPQLGLPILGYYGDWTKSPIFDGSNWIDEPEDGVSILNNECSWNTNVVGSTQINGDYGVIGFYNLGQNVFDSTSTDEQLIYRKENITLSPNGDEYFDRIDDYLIYQLRDAKAIVVEAKDAETGEVYMRKWTSYSTKSLYDAGYSTVIPFSAYGTFPSWNGTDKDGNVLPSGTKCIYSITAYGDGDYGDEVFSAEENRYVTDFDSIIPGEKEPTFNNHKMDMTGDVITFPVVIDTVAPKLENNAVSFYEKDGHTYITGKVYDEDGSLASIEIAPYVTRTYKEGYGDPTYSQVGIDRVNPFYINNIYDAETKEFTFTADVTEYVHSNESYPGENNYYDYKWNGNIIISCGDYGANDRSYNISVNSAEGIVLSQTSALLKVGEQFDLSVNDNTVGINDEIIRTSSNPEVATIDEYGHITAVSAGQAIITVAKGNSSAVCVVAVEEHSKVEDFELSIDNFSGLKPDGELVVKVKNIQPADAEIDNIRWEVSEDEDYANDYAAGIITVGKNSYDALSGFLYLTVAASEDIIPEGHGVLTVTIGDIEKTMDIDWNQIYQNNDEDDLISAESYGSQAVYVTQGETATLTAKYRQTSMHSVGEVETRLTGLKLDGADFFNVGGQYSGKLVNEEGYKLPDDIRMFIKYSDGYEYEIVNYQYYTTYTYDSNTGDIQVNYAPSGADNKLVIMADGIESPDNPAGIMSGNTYEKPEALFGPFDWEVVSGNGELTMGEAVVSGETIEAAKYTPAEPGVSYVTATTKDGRYSTNFAVISEPVLADTLEVDAKNAKIKVGETFKVNATLSPIPSLEKDAAVKWTSFNPSVATVDEDGTITAVSEGYAYIKVAAAQDCTVQSYCIVQVAKGDEKYTVTFKDYDGTVLKEEVVNEGGNATAPDDPSREGYTFTGWDTCYENVMENTIVTAQYSIKSYQVLFKANGEIVKSITKNYGEKISADEYPEVPYKEGYIGSWPDIKEPVTDDMLIEAIYVESSDNSTEPNNPAPSEPGSDEQPDSGNADVDNSHESDNPEENKPDSADVENGATENGAAENSADSGKVDKDKMPVTGGGNWLVSVFTSLIISILGFSLIIKRKKEIE